MAVHNMFLKSQFKLKPQSYLLNIINTKKSSIKLPVTLNFYLLLTQNLNKSHTNL